MSSLLIQVSGPAVAQTVSEATALLASGRIASLIRLLLTPIDAVIKKAADKGEWRIMRGRGMEKEGGWLREGGMQGAAMTRVRERGMKEKEDKGRGQEEDTRMAGAPADVKQMGLGGGRDRKATPSCLTARPPACSPACLLACLPACLPVWLAAVEQQD